MLYEIVRGVMYRANVVKARRQRNKPDRLDRD